MVKVPSLLVERLHLKNFRCFKEATIYLSSPMTIIRGENGSGKTSLFEALYYLCYMRSFRTHMPQDLVRFGQEGFFVKADLLVDGNDSYDMQIGFANGKRLVKVNQKVVCSYKEIMNHYRVVTLTEDDLGLIKNSPEGRRTFLNHALLLDNQDFLVHLRDFKTTLDNRNALLIQDPGNRSMYDLWTEQLWHKSIYIQQLRASFLSHFSQRVNTLVGDFFNNDFTIQFSYKPKLGSLEESFDNFFSTAGATLYHQELRFKRSLFGAHLDDFHITFQHKNSKQYASRGQQKLIVVLLKIAQMQELIAHKGSTIFLLDDFMVDFDEGIVKQLFEVLQGAVEAQLLFTSPTEGSFVEREILRAGGQLHKLTN